MTVIAFSGHRPEKLGGYDMHSLANKNIYCALRTQVTKIVENSDELSYKFIFGGALGIDQMAFDVVYGYKKFIEKYNSKKFCLEIALPFINQSSVWNPINKSAWKQQLKRADIVTEVDKLPKYSIEGIEPEIYDIRKMQKRNEYMVDNADILIAFFDGSKGGTKNCIEYAKEKGIQLIIINPKKYLTKLNEG